MSQEFKVMFPISEKFLEVIDREAGKRGLSRSDFIKTTLAKETGYKGYEQEKKMSYNKKYESPEARKRAQQERNKMNRKLGQWVLTHPGQAVTEQVIKELMK